MVSAVGHVVRSHIKSESGNIRAGIEIPRRSQIPISVIHILEGIVIGSVLLPQPVHNRPIFDLIVCIGETVSKDGRLVHAAESIRFMNRIHIFR